MGLTSLCALIKALRLGAVSFICTWCLCCFLSIILLHLWIVCWMCLWKESVEFLSNVIIWFSCMRVSTFCFSVSLCTVTMDLPLSAFAIVRWLCSITYLLTPWSRVLLEKLTGSAASQDIPDILWNLKVHYHTQSARHLSPSWANSIQSPQPPPTSWRSILILSSHLCLGLPSGLFPSGFPTKTLYTPLPSPYMPHAPPILFFSILPPTQFWVRSTDH